MPRALGSRKGCLSRFCWLVRRQILGEPRYYLVVAIENGVLFDVSQYWFLLELAEVEIENRLPVKVIVLVHKEQERC